MKEQNQRLNGQISNVVSNGVKNPFSDNTHKTKKEYYDLR